MCRAPSPGALAVGSWTLPLCFQGHSRTLTPTPRLAFPAGQPGDSFLPSRDAERWILLQRLTTARAHVVEVVRVTHGTECPCQPQPRGREVPHGHSSESLANRGGGDWGVPISLWPPVSKCGTRRGTCSELP